MKIFAIGFYVGMICCGVWVFAGGPQWAGGLALGSATYLWVKEIRDWIRL